MNGIVFADDREVVYLAFGSNMHADRLARYIGGGSYLTGGAGHAGCRDTTPPACLGVVEVPHRRTFGFCSPFWNGGGVAFLDVAVDERLATPTVAWRMTAGQFADIADQECGGRPSGEPLILPPRPGLVVSRSFGLYDAVLRLPDVQGLPAVTITSSCPPRRHNAPSEVYERLMADGLATAAA